MGLLTDKDCLWYDVSGVIVHVGIIADSHDYKLGHVDGYHGCFRPSWCGKIGSEMAKSGWFPTGWNCLG